MNVFRKIFELYRRWRHTRGFGVHSPFAYRIVTEAVRPARGYIYHAELLPGMTPLRRIAFRIRTLLLSAGYPELSYDFSHWPENPGIPLFIESPSELQTTQITNILQTRNCGLLLSSRSFLFAIARPDMRFVSYTLL